MATVDSTTASPSGARAFFPRNRPVRFSTPSRKLTAPQRPDSACNAGTPTTTLYVREGDTFHEAPARQVLLQAQELIDRQFQSRWLVLSNPRLIRLVLKIQLGGCEHEVFAAFFLDTHRRLLEYVELFRGTIDSAQVHSHEVVKEALARNAAAVILVHNHPSGDAQPSRADEQITQQLKAALNLVGVKLIDHLVVGESVESFVELGLL